MSDLPEVYRPPFPSVYLDLENGYLTQRDTTPIEDVECPICKNDWNVANHLTVETHCGHPFHYACLMRWFYQPRPNGTAPNQCPSCNVVCFWVPRNNTEQREWMRVMRALESTLTPEEVQRRLLRDAPVLRDNMKAELRRRQTRTSDPHPFPFNNVNDPLAWVNLAAHIADSIMDDSNDWEETVRESYGEHLDMDILPGEVVVDFARNIVRGIVVISILEEYQQRMQLHQWVALLRNLAAIRHQSEFPGSYHLCYLHSWLTFTHPCIASYDTGTDGGVDERFDFIFMHLVMTNPVPSWYEYYSIPGHRTLERLDIWASYQGLAQYDGNLVSDWLNGIGDGRLTWRATSATSSFDIYLVRYADANGPKIALQVSEITPGSIVHLTIQTDVSDPDALIWRVESAGHDIRFRLVFADAHPPAPSGDTSG